MAHDHGEKILTCKPCGYWEVTSRFGTSICPNCYSKLFSYSSRVWIIENIDIKFEAIPKERVREHGAFGFI